MKETSKYLDMAAKFLIEIYKDDFPIIATIICAQKDKDYKTIYTKLKSLKDEIEAIEYKLKQEGNI